ncbi:UbiD family decarboxylase [Candidatus Heimdallarchaeota archaeon]|nr:MAG: UbiD family decarboxylase [Candidatus Heimdallarchaeota archaeon]
MFFISWNFGDLMSLRTYLNTLRQSDLVVDISEEVNLDFEVSNHLQVNPSKAVLFSNVKGTRFPLLGNSLSSREQLKLVLNEQDDYYSFFQQSLLSPKVPTLAESSLTFQNKEKVNLSTLPIPRFFPADGGRYLTSGIVFAQYPDTDIPNLSIHRIMVLDDQHGTIRIVPRNLYKIFSENKERGEDTPIALVVGYHPILALASSTPIPSGSSELVIANSLMRGKLSVVKTPRYGIFIPTDVEFVLEGKILADQEVAEGPFVDITGTPDDVRVQPIIHFEEIFYRDQPVFQTILPAFEEHFILMGFPREAAIHNYVSKVVSKVHGVYLTPSGCGWLNAVISITPQSDIDANKAALAAFEAHPSLKWVTVVDEDIDIKDEKAVQWARITRAGANDITVLDNMKGSSLDPSRRKEDNTSIKVIVDATKKKGKTGYERVISF